LFLVREGVGVFTLATHFGICEFDQRKVGGADGFRRPGVFVAHVDLTESARGEGAEEAREGIDNLRGGWVLP